MDTSKNRKDNRTNGCGIRIMTKVKDLSIYYTFPESEYCYFCNAENDVEKIGFEVLYVNGITEKVCSVCLYEYSLSHNAKYIKTITNLKFKEGI